MIRAVDGMREEQEHIIRAFVLMIVFFSLSTIFSFWVVFDFPAALTSSIIFVVAARFWLVYTQRILARFHWRPGDSKIFGGGKSSSGQIDRESEDPINALSRALAAQPVTAPAVVEGDKPKPSQPSRRWPFLRFQEAANQSKASELSSSTSPLADRGMEMSPLSRNVAPSTGAAKRAAAMDGYLGVRGVRPDKEEKWERRYVTLSSKGNIYFYTSRLKYHEDAEAHRVNQRPIQLENYLVRCPPLEKEMEKAKGVVSSGMAVGEMIISLNPREGDAFKSWQLRTDTEEELELWFAALTHTSP